MKKSEISVYIHWPFCKSKCPYCDFNSHVRDSISHDEWLNAYIKEIDFFSNILSGKAIKSIFFGGGTPSLANPKIMDGIINHLSGAAKFHDDIEITLEANPTSIEASKFKDFKNAGINRVSVGIQSLNDENLSFLGREHSSAEALKALDIARSTFDRYTFDLIYSLPNQTLDTWEKELKMALKYADKHISLYQLTIEKGTRFFKDHKDKKFVMPSEDLSADMYAFTTSFMEEYDMPYYETSNYAAYGEESKHNMCYWHYQDYLGIGPGAHGRFSDAGTKFASQMISSPEQWMSSVLQNGHGLQRKDALTNEQVSEEKLLMGLRLREGISSNLIKNKQKLSQLINLGLLEQAGENIAATRNGMLVLNSLIAELS